MVSLKEYHALSDFDQKRRSALESLLYGEEEFLYGIDVYDAMLFTDARASKLALTDQRVIEFKRGFIKENSRDFALDDIASIEHKKGYIMRKITLEGQGISQEYQTLENYGRKFVTTVREQKKRKEEGREPVSVGESSDTTGTSTDEISSNDGEVDRENEANADSLSLKFGSAKYHIIIAIITAWWTFGLFNIGYAGYSYYNYKQLKKA